MQHNLMGGDPRVGRTLAALRARCRLRRVASARCRRGGRVFAGSGCLALRPDDVSGVQILDRGDTPRVQPALDVSEGQRSTCTMRITVSTTMGGQESPPLPMSMVVSLEVVDVTDDTFSVRSTYNDVSVDEDGLPPGLVKEVESGLAVLEGLAITTAPSGALLDTRFALPDGAPPAAHQMVEQLAGSLSSSSVPFPSELVGEGAAWQTVSTAGSNGITLTSTVTYVLEELDGDGYRILSTFDGRFEPVEVGGGVELVRGSLTGTAESAGVLGALMPTTGTSEASTTMVLDIGGRSMKTVTDMDMSLTTELG